MSAALKHLPRAIAFLAGVAAGAIAGGRRGRGVNDSCDADLRKALAGLEAKIAAQKAEVDGRLQQVEARLDEQASKLADVPSTAQIIAAMEQILARNMASLDERLANQAHSIEVLRSTVSQTDGLLERVLESLDSLQTYAESAEAASDAVLH